MDRAAAVLLMLMLIVAVPGVAWLRGLGDTRVELESPAAAPTATATATEPDAAQTGDAPSRPAPADEREDDPIAEPEPEPEDVGSKHESSAGAEPAGPFGTEEVSHGDFPFGGGPLAVLTDVRVAGHDGFDRVVLEFDGPEIPSYRVGYVDPPLVQDGSGEEIHVDGAAFLELRLAPAAGVRPAGTEWERTYTGPYRVTGDTGVVSEVARLDDFEANLAWVVGVPRENPFAVTVLSDPLRLVVDIRTG